MRDLTRALVAAALMVGLAGCGGGGGGGGGTLPPVSGGGATAPVDSGVKPDPDSRNGDFKFFATNGSRQSLKIDFDQLSYTVTDNVGATSSGTLVKPSAPTGRYGVSTASTSGLFAFNDTVVGAVPLAVPGSNPVSYAPYPFIASRALVTTQSNLDGVYNRFRVDSTPTGRDSFIGQVRISGGGTSMTQCLDNVIYRVDKCPAVSVSVSTITGDAENGMWALTSGDGTFLGRFAIARVEGENVYLSAGLSPTSGGGTAIFAIGFPEGANWSAFNGTGGSTGATMDVVVASDAAYSITSTNPAGTQTSANFTLQTMGTDGPLGMRGSDGPGGFFFMRSGKLEAMVGSRSANTAGFLHLGVVN